MVSLSDHKGHVVLVNIWATWCPPCIDEMPSMEALYKEFKGENFEILAVSIDALGAERGCAFYEKIQPELSGFTGPRRNHQNLVSDNRRPGEFYYQQAGNSR